MNRKCLMPFCNLTVNPDGTAAPCCKYDINKKNEELKRQTLYNSNIKELFYQPAMEKIRQQFLNGEEPKECQLCWDEESSGLTSIRQHRFNLSKIEDHKSKYQSLYEEPKIITLDLKFSSLCNLKCRICGPYCSSTWLGESLDTGVHKNTIKIFSKYAERKFVDNNDNFKIFNELIPNLHIIEFYGGEPLMQPEHRTILKMLNDYSDIKNLELYYNTNGTQYDNFFIDVWKKVSIVELNISIDDIKERFEYQRYPAKWSEIEQNIKKFRDNCSTNVNINLYCTVSLYNIFYVDEFIKYNAEKFKLPLRFNLVHYPETMSIKNLPDKIKSIVLSKINNLSKEELSYIEKGFHIDNILNFMLESSTNNFEKFLETTNKHDAYRNQLFKKTFLEYWNALNENN